LFLTNILVALSAISLIASRAHEAEQRLVITLVNEIETELQRIKDILTKLQPGRRGLERQLGFRKTSPADLGHHGNHPALTSPFALCA
jgi:hypothetical protein